MKRESRLGSGLIITSRAGRLSSATGKLSAPGAVEREPRRVLTSGWFLDYGGFLVGFSFFSFCSFCFWFLPFPCCFCVPCLLHAAAQNSKRWSLFLAFDSRLGLCEAESPAPFSAPRLQMPETGLSRPRDGVFFRKKIVLEIRGRGFIVGVFGYFRAVCGFWGRFAEPALQPTRLNSSLRCS